MLPIRPDWSRIVGELYQRYHTYHAILNALADQSVVPADHSFLVHLRSGKRSKVSWEIGSGLMNLYIDAVGPAAALAPNPPHRY